jgi:hypothetical protein
MPHSIFKTCLLLQNKERNYTKLEEWTKIFATFTIDLLTFKKGLFTFEMMQFIMHFVCINNSIFYEISINF